MLYPLSDFAKSGAIDRLEVVCKHACMSVSGGKEFHKVFHTSFPFPMGFQSKVLKQFACFSFSVSTSSVIFYGSSVLQQTFILFFPFCFTRGTAEIHQLLRGETRNGHREN